MNSAFKGTGLLEYLRKQGENTIVIVGLQTDYCMDATIKCGFEHGFKMIVPANTNSTINNEFMSAEKTYEYYNHFIWNRRFADCKSFEKTIELMKNVVSKNCPCKRLKCERHGDCDACNEYHHFSKKIKFTVCEQIIKKENQRK